MPQAQPTMMEIDEDDVLRAVAGGGSMDYSVWPALLPRIVSRMEKIAREEFPTPRSPAPATTTIPSSIPPPPAAASAAPTSDGDEGENFLPPMSSSPIEPESTSSPQDANNENTPIAPRTAPPSSAPAGAVGATLSEPGALPPQITAYLVEITNTLTGNFPNYPPHTIQRLAELILTPKHHYKSLPAYLHALDRVVHVTSGLNVYPLPPAVPEPSTVSLLSNGVSDPLAPSPWATPGSDEALGGALLTPIPWLQNQQPEGSPQAQQSQSSEHANGSDLEGEVRTESTETIDGPNGMGHIETVTVTVNGVPSMGARGVGVTQGELLRQEQRAGVVPASQLNTAYHVQQQQQQRAAQADTPRPNNADAEGAQTEEASGAAPRVGEEEERPHARGPEEIGPEDMGPQRETSTSYLGGPGVEMQGIDVEAAVGRRATESSHTSPPPEAGAKTEEQQQQQQVDGDSKEDDKMDGVESTTTAAATEPSQDPSATPKREAEDEAEGMTKKMREDEEPGGSAEGSEKKPKDDDDSSSNKEPKEKEIGGRDEKEEDPSKSSTT